MSTEPEQDELKSLDAEEARALSGMTDKATARELVNIYALVRHAATRKECSIVLRSPSEVYNTYPQESEWNPVLKGIVAKLRSQGYTVTAYYEEQQFTDLGLKISWSI